MPARVTERVLRSFRLGAEGLKDLDALVRARCQDFVAAPELRYTVVRRDAFSYVTADVDDILAERNGAETAIREIVLVVDHGDDVRLRLSFGDAGVELDASANDRAKLLLLTSELRSLARDRLRGRGDDPRSKYVRAFVWPAAMLLSVVVYTLLSMRSDDAYERANAAFERESRQFEEREREEAQEAVRTARSLLESEDIDSKLNFLIEQARREAEFYTEVPPYPGDSLLFEEASSSYYTGFTGLMLILGAGAIFAFLASSALSPKPERRFVIGDEVARLARRDKLRENVIWGVLVAFGIGVLSSVAVTIFA